MVSCGHHNVTRSLAFLAADPPKVECSRVCASSSKRLRRRHCRPASRSNARRILNVSSSRNLSNARHARAFSFFFCLIAYMTSDMFPPQGSASDMTTLSYAWRDGDDDHVVRLVRVPGTDGRPFLFGTDPRRRPLEVRSFYLTTTPITQALWTPSAACAAAAITTGTFTTRCLFATGSREVTTMAASDAG